MGKIFMHGSRLTDWRETSRTGTQTTLLSPNLAEMEISGKLETAWLNQQTY
jgi:hypothetical protein